MGLKVNDNAMFSFAPPPYLLDDNNSELCGTEVCKSLLERAFTQASLSDPRGG